jgi:hypothetical protein
MSIKSAARVLPPIRRLHDDRNRLAFLSESLSAQVEKLKQELVAPNAGYLALSQLYSRILFDEAGSDDPVDGLFRNADSWLNFDEIGRGAPYRKTYNFAGPYINAAHKVYADCPTGRFGNPVCIDIGLDGYLQHGDALKLYEMAFHAPGDILELGTHKGLSTSILAQARADSGRTGMIETDDIDGEANKIAKTIMKDRPGAEYVNFNLNDANAFMLEKILEQRKFSFIFVDHWHGYKATLQAATYAKELLEEGGFILFHDYNDPSNSDPAHVYGVYQAVCDTLIPDENYQFFGISGCTALFRKKPAD